MEIEVLTEAAASSVVVRLLNGPLRGCEYSLPLGRTLFVVGSGAELSDASLMLDDVLFIPLERERFNFELFVAPERVVLRELRDNDRDCERDVEFNRVLRVGALELALRSGRSDWSEDILEYPSDALQFHRRRWGAVFVVLGIVLVGMGALWVAFGQRYIPAASEFLARVRELTSVPVSSGREVVAPVVQEFDRFPALVGRDGITYVVVDGERDRARLERKIGRGGYANSVRVVNPSEEGARIGRWLADRYANVAYFRLQMDDPRRPQVWVSRQRTALDARQINALAQRLVVEMPYASEVAVVKVDDVLASTQAEEGLARQAVPYTRSDHPGGVTFVIRGGLSDDELSRAHEFVADYYRKWGMQYVQFVIELKDDLLKGKSLMQGDQGYVKMSAGHWYFPNPL